MALGSRSHSTAYGDSVGDSSTHSRRSLGPRGVRAAAGRKAIARYRLLRARSPEQSSRPTRGVIPAVVDQLQRCSRRWRTSSRQGAAAHDDPETARRVATRAEMRQPGPWSARGRIRTATRRRVRAGLRRRLRAGLRGGGKGRATGAGATRAGDGQGRMIGGSCSARSAHGIGTAVADALLDTGRVTAGFRRRGRGGLRGGYQDGAARRWARAATTAGTRARLRRDATMAGESGGGLRGGASAAGTSAAGTLIAGLPGARRSSRSPSTAARAARRVAAAVSGPDRIVGEARGRQGRVPTTRDADQSKVIARAP